MTRQLHLAGRQLGGTICTASDHHHLARTLERGKFDMVFLDDVLLDELPVAPTTVTLDPAIVAASIGAVTTKLGIAITKSAIHLHPSELAGTFASLDHVTSGRVAWNVDTSLSEGESQDLPHDFRYERANQFVTTTLAALSGVPDSPQGRPVLVQAGDGGTDFAVRWAEVMVTTDATPEGRRACYDDLKGRIEDYGRDPDTVLIMPTFLPFVGETESIANEKQAYYDEQSDGDGLLPRFVGTAAQVADQIEESFTAGEADGFLVSVARTPSAFNDFVDAVVPELQRRKLFRDDYAGHTLRDHLGLQPPAYDAPRFLRSISAAG